MPDDPTLQAQAESSATDSTETTNAEPAGGANAEEGKSVADKDTEVKEGEGAKEVKLTEAEKIRLAMQKRIDRKTAVEKSLQERTRQLEQEIAQYKANAPKDSGEPKQDDFKTYEEWENALIEHRAEKRAEARLAEAREKELNANKERQAQETRRQFETKEANFRKSTADYDRVAGEAVQVMNDLGAVGVDIVPLRDAIMAFDNPPEMIYQLGKSPELLEDLARMEPLKAMRELVKLELSLQGTQETAKSVPEPIKSLASSKAGNKPLYDRSGKDILAWVKTKT